MVRRKNGRSGAQPLGIGRRPVKRRALGEGRHRPLERVDLTDEGLVALGRLASPIELLLRAREIGERELELEGVQVVDRVGAADHVLVDERPQHVHDRVDLADAAEEPVAQALALGRAPLQPRDVDELGCGVHDLARRAHHRERVDSRIGNRRHADVGLRGRERVRRDGRRAAGERVEQGRLPALGRPDDAESLHRGRG